jgi:hypothetical protein
VAADSSVEKSLPNLKTWCINLVPGQKIEKLRHGGDVFGYAILNKPDGREFNSLVIQMKKALSIQFEERALH